MTGVFKACIAIAASRPKAETWPNDNVPASTQPRALEGAPRPAKQADHLLGRNP